MSRRLLSIWIVGLSLVAGTCKENTGPARAVAIASVALTDNQTGVVGQPLPQPITVKVTDASGNPVSAVAVAFAVTTGGGTLAATSVQTTGQGLAAVNWTLGNTAGTNNNKATATVTGLTGSPVTFTATAVAGPAAQIAPVSGDAQQAEVGAALAQPMVVLLTDALGNPAAGHPVNWTVTAGGGTVTNSSTVADALGHATVAWTLGYTLGAQTLRATIPGVVGPAANFGATGVLSGGQLSASSGDQQLGAASAALPRPVVALVRTSGGNPVAGVSVSWQVTSGGGTVSTPSSVTDSQGHASVSWTLGSGVGSQSATATVTGLTGSPVTFTATAIATSPSSITGAVTIEGGYLAPPPPASLARLRGGRVALQRTARQSGEVDAAPLLGPLSRGAGREARFSPHNLIVTFRSGPLGAPPMGARVFANGATAAAVSSAMRARLTPFTVPHRLRLTDVSPVILAARLYVERAADADSVAALLASDPAVLSVNRDQLIYADMAFPAPGPGDTIPNDPNYKNQSWHYVMIDLPRAWMITTGSTSVTVAVVDNGIRFDHPGVAANLTADGYDFVSQAQDSLCSGDHIDNADDGDGYDPDPTIPDDFLPNNARTCLGAHFAAGGHGLHVAGTIGAVGNDGMFGSGVNWTVRIRPVRVLGLLYGSDFDAAQGVLYAAGLPASNGAGGTLPPPTRAPIINLSLGYTCPGFDDPLHNAMIAATNAGSLAIAAAGNDGESAPHCPAAYPEALSVSAVGPDGLLAPYSNFAGTSGIAAPGGDFPSGTDGTTGIYSTTCDFTVKPCTPNQARYIGTSMATAHVSGVAALILAANPGLTNAQLRSRLTTYAVDVGTAGPDAQYGAGIVNARNSLTQTLAPPTQLYARLYDATTGTIVATQAVAGNGTFTFNALADGSYYVFAGEDENGDGLIGVPGRRWGALGGTARPAAVAVSTSAGGAAFFPIGLPTEAESNNATGSADQLVVGGYIHGILSPTSDPVDVLRVAIPQAGQYTFATSGWQGAFCKFGLNVNTILTLSDALGAQLATNDDINAAGNNFCSAISMTLSPGTYYLSVTPGVDFNSPPQPDAGRYRLEARAGP